MENNRFYYKLDFDFVYHRFYKNALGQASQLLLYFYIYPVDVRRV